MDDSSTEVLHEEVKRVRRNTLIGTRGLGLADWDSRSKRCGSAGVVWCVSQAHRCDGNRPSNCGTIATQSVDAITVIANRPAHRHLRIDACEATPAKRRLRSDEFACFGGLTANRSVDSLGGKQYSRVASGVARLSQGDWASRSCEGERLVVRVSS